MTICGEGDGAFINRGMYTSLSCPASCLLTTRLFVVQVKHRLSSWLRHREEEAGPVDTKTWEARLARVIVPSGPEYNSLLCLMKLTRLLLHTGKRALVSTAGG